MLFEVEVIKRPYRKYKVGERFSLKEKQARILILLNRVKKVEGPEQEKQAAPPASVNSQVTDDNKPRRGRKPGSKNKPK